VDDKLKAKAELIKELVGLRQKVSRLAAVQKKYQNVIALLGQREGPFYQLTENSPFPVIIFASNGKTEYVNSKFTELLGYTVEDIPTRQSWREKAYPIPQYRRQVIQEIETSEISGKQGLKRFDRKITCADGSMKDGILHSLYLADGGYCIVIADITELKKGQTALDVSRERFRTIYKNSPVPAFLWKRGGDDFTLVDFSDSADEFTKANLIHWIGARMSKHFSDAPHFVEDTNRCFSEKTVVKNEYWYHLRTTGEMKYVASFYIFIFPDLVLIYFVDITPYKRIEESLKENEKRLELEARRLEEANTALKVLLDYRVDEKRRIQENIATTVTQLILPFVERLDNSPLDDGQRVLISAIKSNLAEITSPFATKLSYRCAGLSPTEFAVANLVREGKRIKEAADTLSVTEDTVRFHRKNIRAKLGLKRKKLNLHSYLQQLSNE
jgi:PAS domain S-box-containing protein